MSLLITLLIAFGITIVACLLLYVLLLACLFVPILFRPRRYGFRFVKADDDANSFHRAVLYAFFAFVYLLVLGTLCLPPQWRVYVAVVTAPLVFNIFVFLCCAPARMRS